jgi:hypothetical protein
MSTTAAAAASGSAAVAAQQPPAAGAAAAAAGANSSISSQLRSLADALDGAACQKCAKQVGEALQALAQQLLHNSQEQEQGAPTG